MARDILFVTHLTKGFEAGFTYCTELARFMENEIVVLIVSGKEMFSDGVDNPITEVTFAEANEHNVILELITSDTDNRDYSKEINFLTNRCCEMEVGLNIYHSVMNVATAVKTLLKQRKGIDIVMLGTTVTERGDMTANNLNRLLKSVSRPVVTIENKAALRN